MAIEVGKLKYYLKHQFIEMFSIQHWVLWTKNEEIAMDAVGDVAGILLRDLEQARKCTHSVTFWRVPSLTASRLYIREC
jgi:hypothetical protein